MAKKTVLQVVIDPTGAKSGAKAASDAFSKMRQFSVAQNKLIQVGFSAMFKSLGGQFSSFLSLASSTFRSLVSITGTAISKMSGYFWKLAKITGGGVLKAFKSVFGFLTGKLMDAVRDFGVAFAAAFGIKAIVRAGIEMQKYTATLSVATGTLASARTEISWLLKLSNKLGISFSASVMPFAKLMASAKGALSAESTRDIFRAFGKVSAALRLEKQEVTGVFLALQQIASKGVVSMEELRLQLAERVPGAMKIAAASMNMNMKDFEYAVTQRLIPASIFLKRFSAELEREFGPAAEKAAGMAQASFIRLGNALFDMKQRISDTGMLTQLGIIIDQITSWVTENPEVWDELGVGLATVFGHIADLLTSISASDVKTFFDTISKMVKDTYTLIKSEFDTAEGDLSTFFKTIFKKAGLAIIEGIEEGIKLGIDKLTQSDIMLKLKNFFTLKQGAYAAPQYQPGYTPDNMMLASSRDAGSYGTDESLVTTPKTVLKPGTKKVKAELDINAMNKTLFEQTEKVLAEAYKRIGEIDIKLSLQEQLTKAEEEFTRIDLLARGIAPEMLVLAPDKRMEEMQGYAETIVIAAKNIQKIRDKIAKEDQTIANDFRRYELQQDRKLADDQAEIANTLMDKKLELRKNDFSNMKSWYDAADVTAKDYAESIGTMSESISGAFSNAFKSMEDSLIEMTKTGKLNFTNMADSIINDLLRILIQQNMVKPIATGMSTAMSGAGTWLSSLFETQTGANGTIFSGPFQAFANGSPYVNQPTLGLIGEGRYPEAVIPLPDGRTVPVTMSGRQQTVLQMMVNITNNSDATVTATESKSSNGQPRLDVVIDKQVAKAVRGGPMTNRALRDNFNLAPGLTRR